MIVSIALIILFGLWLIGVSIFALLRPRKAIAAIGNFASTNLINYSELGLRALVGAAFVHSHDASPAPAIFATIGWGLIVSSLLIALAPRRWHSAYAQYCAKNIPPFLVYIFAPVSMIAGGFLIVAFTQPLLRAF